MMKLLSNKSTISVEEPPHFQISLRACSATINPTSAKKRRDSISGAQFSQIFSYKSEVTKVMEEIHSFMKILLSESNMQNQDMTMIKNDLTLLQIGHASLQHTSASQSYQLNNNN